MTKLEGIIKQAESIKDGDTVELIYRRPVKTLKGFDDILMKESKIITTFDERGYFEQVRAQNGVNLNPERDPIYKKIMGALIQHIEKGDLYIRITAPSKATKKFRPAYYRNGKRVPYSRIEKYLYADEKKDYESYDRQEAAIEASGNEDTDKIISIPYKVERIVSIKVSS